MKIDNLEILNGLIAGAEGGTVEFKETTGQLERGMETLCAFLNGTGGTVLFDSVIINLLKRLQK